MKDFKVEMDGLFIEELFIGGISAEKCSGSKDRISGVTV